MARLTSDQWRDVRSEWEASATQGLAWLVAANGGKWHVTEEAVRLRRKAEGWQKRGTLGSVVEKAQLQADARAHLGGQVGDEDSYPRNGGPGSTYDPDLGPAGAAADAAEAARSAGVEQAAVDLRAELIERHRNEWKLARKQLYKASKIADNASGFEAAKFAKINSETLTLIQAGERKAWGLDAVQIDLQNLSDDQLERIASGRMPT